MSDIMQLSARALAAAVAQRELTAEAVARAFLERIAAAEAHVQAWQYQDPAGVLQAARALDQGATRGPLAGLPIGVKDLMDTADMPTTYGSRIYAEHRPQVDAACVAMARAAGALVMGKTVTTEFATFHPGPTRNPRAPADAPRTPGGSSSGSAAAVAAGMVPVAFGTQTAGSIVRPAAYCGVVGFKPTHGTLPIAGVKALSPSLDTVGALARSVDDVAFFVGTLAGTDYRAAQGSQLRVGLCRTPHWELAGDDTRRLHAEAGRLFERAGAAMADVALPAVCDGLMQAQIDIMGHEARSAFAPERRTHAHLFSAAFADFLAQAEAVDGERFAAAQRAAERARLEVQALFASVDVLVAPSTQGEAPPGLQATGNPVFNRLWTLLGLPCVHVPLGTGEAGMPVGVTVIAARWADAQALAAAQVLERAVAHRSA